VESQNHIICERELMEATENLVRLLCTSWQDGVVAAEPVEQFGWDWLFVDEDLNPSEEEKGRDDDDQVEGAEQAAGRRTEWHFLGNYGSPFLGGWFRGDVVRWWHKFVCPYQKDRFLTACRSLYSIRETRPFRITLNPLRD
jgi:hypothetical protein